MSKGIPKGKRGRDGQRSSFPFEDNRCMLTSTDTRKERPAKAGWMPQKTHGRNVRSRHAQSPLHLPHTLLCLFLLRAFLLLRLFFSDGTGLQRPGSHTGFKMEPASDSC
ncbi:uncharacterized protein SPSK_02060 [Sporothrix schenckii 1099-18]|uniref:Uncharacterized protein n=1 Tax=Sporothrix schenckii 1099-18 TaxID=1397361 RepID=A0A0F2MG80_SPOSC|nr:uncharacterized protein SPSK_02060 [Sporothrix schenckii 1099-18]KJR87171.1 hypothetical protein SPSK_02060 [Sporothrix schenckii 1099-18]